MTLSDLAVGAKVTRAGFTIAQAIAARVGRFRRDRRQIHHARHLIGINSNQLFNYRVAMQHPMQIPGTPHPDDAYAFVSVASEDACRAMELKNFRVEETLPADLDDGYVLIGSPEAELLTAVMFGYERKPPDGGMKYLGSTIDLPYRWDEDRSNVVATCSRLVPGQGRVTRPNWPIVDNTGTRTSRLYPVVQNNGLLHTDLLLITKVPNYLSATALQSGRTVVSIAGAHGTGTRAVEVLLRDRRCMREIAERVKTDAQAFQILVEVGNVNHHPLNGSVASSVQIRDVRCFSRSNSEWERAGIWASKALQSMKDA
ncbi:hypothetical protein BH11ACT7_BH11ACT7_04450 [soil metagenome]